MTVHSKGPWVNAGRISNTNDNFEILAKGKAIAIVLSVPDPDEQKANARLIENSLEMLETLQTVADVISHFYTATCTNALSRDENRRTKKLALKLLLETIERVTNPQ